jgi:hypothetical protein
MESKLHSLIPCRGKFIKYACIHFFKEQLLISSFRQNPELIVEVEGLKGITVVF